MSLSLIEMRAGQAILFNAVELPICDELQVYRNDSGLNIYDIQKLPEDQWQDYNTFNFPVSGKYWLRLKSPLVTVHDEPLTIVTSLFDSLCLYAGTSATGWDLCEGGNRFSNESARMIYGPYSCLWMQLDPGTEYEVYMEAVDVQRPSFQFLSKDFTLSTEKIITNKSDKGRFSIYIFIGACLIMLLYNLALSFFYERSGYLILAGFIIAIAAYTFALSGEMVGLVFEYGAIQNQLIVYFGSASMLFYIPFAQIILRTKLHAPRVHKWLTALISVMLLALLLFLLGFDYLAIPISFLVAFLVFPIVLGVAWVGRNRVDQPNRYFLWANFIAISCWVITFLQMFGILPAEILWMNSAIISEIGVAFMLLIFSMALGAKVNYISSELVRKELEQEKIKREEEEKRNELIRSQNERLEQTVKERTAELREEKALVEEKNMEIMDSIAYAKYLQDAMLPAPKLLKEMFPDSGLLYMPKDVVSGDFYWFQEYEGHFYVAVVDCTGHGVPGAMVSVIGFNALHRCVNELHVTDPGEILNQLSRFVEDAFTSTDENVRDGMDISLVKYNPASQVIEYAGAYNPLWVLRQEKDSIEEIKAERRPIGKYHINSDFQTKTMQLAAGDIIYLFSDGYADQFGGKKGKKLKPNNFQLKLIEIRKLAMNDQRIELGKFILEWMGNYEQVDDICVIGFRV